MFAFVDVTVRPLLGITGNISYLDLVDAWCGISGSFDFFEMVNTARQRVA